ncbi:hypothetical protein NC651_018343 [Populus alba x Populus x berolinensis]|nr:hypothetical protein NC651_018343 [Populus alba x Populus x berolinensis]
MAMQPIASSSNAPPPSSPTTPAALGPPRADLCSSKNSHHRSTTTSNPFVHHKQEEGSILALQQRHMKVPSKAKGPSWQKMLEQGKTLFFAHDDSKTALIKIVRSLVLSCQITISTQ